VTRPRVVGFALLWSTALTACGGSDGGEERSLSAPEFRQQASAICEKSGSQIAALRQPDGINSLRYFLDQSVPIIEEGNNKLAELEAPDDLSGDWDRALELQGQSLQVARDLQKAIHDNDTARVQDLVSQLAAADAESTRLARNIGLENCGQQN